MMFWVADVELAPDQYAAFRGGFELAEQAEVEIALWGMSWFVVWLDGVYLAEGPARYDLDHPEYEVLRRNLPPGRHVLAIQATYIGIDTRILESAPPFVECRVSARGSPVEIAWKGVPLPGYQAQVRRINPQLGWIEWCDTRQNPADWEMPEFDDAAWPPARPAESRVGTPVPMNAAPVRRVIHALQPMASGPLANVFGYALDDPPAWFFLRDLECADRPPQGLWRRYDLGRVRLGRPRFVLDLPAGAVVEFACAEHLDHGRVAPFINLSAGDSANLDHYVARGGVQVFEPLTPKGGRYLEVHVLADPGPVRFLEESYAERAYFGEAAGRFACSDPLLNRVWQVGVDTLRACAEDGLTDNPTRERGQWTGDVVGVGMDIAAAAFSDLRLLRRGLVQSAQSARDDGLVAGMAPGGSIYLASYAAQWVTACVHYCRLTGDRALLAELWGAAERNVAALERDPEIPGIPDGVAWNFIDWGYDPPETPIDPALNLHYLDALEAMAAWAAVLGEGGAAAYSARAEALRGALAREMARILDGGGFEALGYHASVLALGRGFFEGARAAEAQSFVKAHILRCFPNDPDAPRLSDPGVQSKRLVTPYFAHYAFPVLIEGGGMDFVLDQFRACWGWMLGTGATTWLEVFDTRWSHCHQWAGCPTWQLTRYALGLHPRFDRGPGHFDFRFEPGGLDWAEGAIPLGDGEVRVAWKRDGGKCLYTVESAAPVYISGLPGEDGAREVAGKAVWTF